MAWTNLFRRKHREIGVDYLVSEDGFQCLAEDGIISSVEWDDLVWVKIFTTDNQDEQDEDLYWSLADTEREYIIPNCKDLHNVFPRLAGKLSGFDSDIMQEAMASSGEKQYTCWKK